MFGRPARTAVAVAANHDCAQDNVDAIGHVEAVLRGWEAFNHRDFAGAVQYLHPDGEAHLPPGRRDPVGGGDVGRLHGRDEVRRFLEKVSYAWQRVTVELTEVIVVPNGRLLAVEGWRIQGRDIEVAAKSITVYMFREGLVARLDGFVDRAKAFEALGAGRAQLGTGGMLDL
jgi:ketosteroid isomerase-like protein